MPQKTEQKGNNNKNIQIITKHPDCIDCSELKYLKEVLSEMRAQNQILLSCLTRVLQSNDLCKEVDELKEKISQLERHLNKP